MKIKEKSTMSTRKFPVSFTKRGNRKLIPSTWQQERKPICDLRK